MLFRSLGTFDATPKVPLHTGLTGGEHRGSRHHLICAPSPLLIETGGSIPLLCLQEDKRLLFEGWTVIRFWGKDIKRNTDECVKAIEEIIFDTKVGDREEM